MIRVLWSAILFKKLSFWGLFLFPFIFLFAAPLRAQQGLFFREEALNQAIQEALPSYLNHFLADISESIISEAKKQTTDPFKTNIKKEIPVIRDFFARRSITFDNLDEIRENYKTWLDQIKTTYLSNKTFGSAFVQSEMISWEVFFENVLATELNDDKDQLTKLIREFQSQRAAALGGAKEFQEIIESSGLEIFPTNRKIFLSRLTKLFGATSKSSDLPEWLVQSQKSWEEILDELENWDLQVDVDIAVKAEIESVGIDPRFNSGSSDVVGQGRLTANPEIKFQRLTLNLLRRGTGEMIEIASDLARVEGDQDDWDHPDAIIWTFTKPLVIKADGSFDFDMRRVRPQSNDENASSVLQPIDIHIESVETNFNEIEIKEAGVQKLMTEVFNQQKISFALDRLSQQALFDRMKIQIQDDVMNYLRNESFQFSIIIFQDEDGKIEFEIGVKNNDFDKKIATLQDEGRFVSEIVSESLLSVEDFEVNLLAGESNLEIEVELPETKWVSAKIGDFDFPGFLFEGESNDLVRSIMSYFDQNAIELSEASLEAKLRLKEPSEEKSTIKLYVPIRWETSTGADFSIPNFKISEMTFNLDELGEARIEEVKFRSTNNSPWVELNFQDKPRIQDQLYAQLSQMTQNFENLTGENFEKFLNQELQARLQTLVLQVGEADEASASTEEKIRIIDFEFPAEAIKIDWDAEAELIQRRLHDGKRIGLNNKQQGDFTSVFHRLPKEFRIFQDQKGDVIIKTDLKLPKSFRIRLQNIDDEEAFIETLEFSVAAEEEKTATVFWKILQDAKGRLIILPQISNLDSVIAAYHPVLDQTSGPDSLVARGVRPKSFSGRAAEWINGKLIQSGYDRGVVAGLFGQMYVEKEKRERISKKINEVFHKKLQEKLPNLVLDLLKLTNGYVLEPLDQRLSERASYDPEAVMPALQKEFERIVDGLIEKRLLRSDLSNWKLGEQKVLDRLQGEIKDVVTDRLDADILGQSYGNLRDEVSSTLIELPETIQSALEGGYQPQAEKPNWVRRLEAGEKAESIEDMPSDINSFIQGFVPYLEEVVNEVFVEMKIPEEISESFARRKENPSRPQSSESPLEPQTIFYLPDHFCVPDLDTSLSEIFESSEGLISEPQSVVPIYAFHESQGGSLIPTHVSDELRQLVSNHLRKRYWQDEDPEVVESRTPDAIAFMSLESLHENLIAPNLQEFKRYIREVAAIQKPGTDLSLNDIQLELKEVDGQLRPFAKIKMRLRYKKGLLDYDTGRDKSGEGDFEFSLPVRIGVQNLFDHRPDFEADEWHSGYNLSLSFDYPVSFDHPNFHDIVDEWIKKEVVYPELAEALIFQSTDEGSGAKRKRTINVPIAQTLGMPLVMKDAPIELRQLFFDRDSTGKDHVLLEIKFGQFRTDFSAEAPFELPFDTKLIKESLQKYYGEDNFFLEEDALRLLSNMFERSKERRRAIHEDETLMMNIRSESSGISFDENGKGFFNFEVLLSSQKEKLPSSIRVKMPFEVFKAAEGWVLDPEAAVEVKASSPVSSESLQSILQFFRETNPEPLILHQFKVISGKPSDSQEE